LAKENIFRHQKKGSLLVLNRENSYTYAMAEKAGGAEIAFFSSERTLEKGICLQNGVIYVDGKEILQEEDILLPGKHNRENYMAAIAVTKGLVSRESIYRVATTFKGVEHRLETIRVHKGVRYINSSIDSSPSRTAAALGCFDEKVICICGGYDKHIPFAPLADALCQKAKAVVLTGATADAIEQALIECESTEKPMVLRHADFKEAVLLASSLAKEGDTVILSPACASFDAFKNFMERGDTFRTIISELE
jgi:UDP-N-acetylmuramoylalanine--D-glutamate ligase